MVIKQQLPEKKSIGKTIAGRKLRCNNRSIVNIIYRAGVKCSKQQRYYFGSTEAKWKQRFHNDKFILHNESYRKVTALSKHHWQINESLTRNNLELLTITKCYNVKIEFLPLPNIKYIYIIAINRKNIILGEIILG